VVAKANPAVVSIVITKDVPVIEQYYQQYNLFGYLNTPQQNQGDTQQEEIGGGSGFFVTSDGYIVTNSHVVEDSTATYTVITSDGKKHDAKILAKDSTLDVAIIKIDGNDFNYLTFGNSDNLKLGQTAIAIGNALAQYQNSISMGIISGLSRSIVAGDSSTGNSEQLDGVIQTDAAINPGNSGGPLLDIKGNVIGVNVAIENNAENISFALPGNMVKGIVDSVKKNGEIVKPYLGVRYTQVTESLKTTNNLSVDYGVLVSRGTTADELAVIPGSPADKAGIVENDIILYIDGVKLDGSKSLASIIRQKQVDQTIKLKILHDGKEKEVTVKLEKAPSNL
jgi:serine protease Do